MAIKKRAALNKRSEKKRAKEEPPEKRSEGAVIDFDEEKQVIIQDELAEVQASDPTFAGMRAGARLEEAYSKFLKDLRELHRDRFRHPPPADPVDLFEELAGELILPGERELRLYVTRMKANKPFAIEEEEEILKYLDKFNKISANEPSFSE